MASSVREGKVVVSAGITIHSGKAGEKHTSRKT
jgi:hypothetical protein